MRIRSFRALVASAAAIAALALGAPALRAQDAGEAVATVPEMEDIDIAVLPPASPRWVVLLDSWTIRGARIIDGDSGKIVGMLDTPTMANVAIDPQGRSYYVAETIWTRRNRGVRQDLLSVYDSRTLKLVAEIDLPGRLLTGNRRQTLDLSADGRYAYIFNMEPASSVIVVDLRQRKVVQTIEVPGCGLVFAASTGTFASLCTDGTLATARIDARKKPTVSHTDPFFSAEDDPIFDNGIVDRATGKAVFISYSGLIYQARIGAEGVQVEAPWSIQQAAGMQPASTAPLNVAWLPGGRQAIAWHRASGRIYALMHMGEFWTHKEGGREVWVLDGNSRKLLARHKLEEPVGSIAVGQDEHPLLFLNGDSGLSIRDAETFEEKHQLNDVGVGLMTVTSE